MTFKNIFTPRVLIIAGIILFAAIMRLIPHYPNFTPIAAIALFGGAHLGKKWLSFFVPLFALFLSDLIIGLHAWMLPVYISFALVVVIGNQIRNSIGVGSVFLASVSSSMLFFLITNFAVWIGSPYYAQSFAGLMQSYTMGLPFFHTALLGDLFYNSVFFGGFYFISRRYPSLVTMKIKS
ncbi:MAG: DUF6580 family putative transport protein [Bacteroidota bacterium]